ncbi:permease [Specibacter sp. NPDC057265]|uniref:permease n=1 Tax=Specibacter sp. NPDC057265 TaxID=3346075 RepID=UPI003645F4F8
MSAPSPTFAILAMLSRPSPGNKAVLTLPAVAFALVTALSLLVLAGAMSFFTHPIEASNPDLGGTYQMLAGLALALLIAPLLTLGGSAARLSARRRDERLSTLRLLGGTPALVGTISIVESTVVAAAGIAAGVVLYAVALPAVALIQFQGKARGLAQLWLNPLLVLATAAVLVALAAISAAAGLRHIVLTPLGVRTRQKAPTAHWMRLALGAVAAMVLFAVMSGLSSSGSVALVVVLLCASLAGGMALLNLVGPYALQRGAGRSLRRAATPARLLASRIILESPKAAWRQVSSLSMTSFIAVIAGTGLALMAATSEAGSAEDINLVNDMRMGVLITVLASFLLVACSAGVNQAAAIFDRRDLYVSLNRLGMPRPVMDAARKRAALSPVRIVTAGSATLAAVLLFPLTGAAMIFAPLSLLVIAAVLSAGIALVWLGLAATGPVLDKVLDS